MADQGQRIHHRSQGSRAVQDLLNQGVEAEAEQVYLVVTVDLRFLLAVDWAVESLRRDRRGKIIRAH